LVAILDHKTTIVFCRQYGTGSFIYTKIEEMDRDYAQRQDRIAEREARRVLAIRKQKKDDEL